MEVITKDIVNINIDKLTTDGDENPNYLSDEQMAALRESMQRFGYLQPIIIDEDADSEGKHMVCDGFHRLQVYKDFKRDVIPVYTIKFRDRHERKLLRQIMNKLHGEHEPQKDLVELQELIESGYSDSLQSLLQINENKIKELQTLTEAPSQAEWRKLFDKTDYGLDEGDKPNLDDKGLYHAHQVTVYFTDSEFEHFNSIMDGMQDLSNTTQKILTVLTEWQEYRNSHPQLRKEIRDLKQQLSGQSNPK